ncbi:MAG: potassium channel family protein, partial [Chloroflexi bacterium]|nr:potassium channel family protein [Chloroflexota bacterium]
MESLQRLRWSLGILVLIVCFGVLGYIFIEGWTPFDALYMTVITLTTVGYSEMGGLSLAGRAFTMFLIVFGVGGMLYTLTGARLY